MRKVSIVRVLIVLLCIPGLLKLKTLFCSSTTSRDTQRARGIQGIFFSTDSTSKSSRYHESVNEHCKSCNASIGLNVLSHLNREREPNLVSSLQTNNPFSPLSMRDIESVRQFVFFIGYSRSGHSIVGSLLDAHPNMIFAHEFTLFRKLWSWSWKQTPLALNRTNLYNRLWANSYNSAHKGWRSNKTTAKGYNLYTGSLWQGKFEQLFVIGDKSGGTATEMYQKSAKIFNNLLEDLKKIVQVSIKVIYVIRNPYDIISTRALYRAIPHKLHTKINATTEHKYSNISLLHGVTNQTIKNVKSNHAFIASTSLEVLEVHFMDLINSPDQTLKSLCTFLGVGCPQDYVDTCAQKLYKTVPITRETVVWPKWLVDKVQQEIIQPFPSFRRYSFHGA